MKRKRERAATKRKAKHQHKRAGNKLARALERRYTVYGR